MPSSSRCNASTTPLHLPPRRAGGLGASPLSKRSTTPPILHTPPSLSIYPRKNIDPPDLYHQSDPQDRPAGHVPPTVPLLARAIAVACIRVAFAELWRGTALTLIGVGWSVC